MMRRLLASTLAWLVLLGSLPVHAQASEQSAPVPPAPSEPMLHPTDGRQGVWMELALARDCRAAMVLEDSYLEQLALASRRLDLRAREASELRAAVLSATARGDELGRALGIAEASRLRALERAERGERWYRAPALWMGVGVVLGAGLAVLLAFAIGGST